MLRTPKNIEISNLLNDLKGKALKHFSVSTNDSKFDNVSDIIGNNLKEREMYCITNNPLSDGNYIQGGRTHTVLGMEYGDHGYGFQLSMSHNNIKYRKLKSGTWSEWQDIDQGTGLVYKLVTDFNNLVAPGCYAYGGQQLTNKPSGTGLVEVIVSSPYILQRITSASNIGTRISYDNGATWSSWKYFSN